jgi:hypothetical protein
MLSGRGLWLGPLGGARRTWGVWGVWIGVCVCVCVPARPVHTQLIPWASCPSEGPFEGFLPVQTLYDALYLSSVCMCVCLCKGGERHIAGADQSGSTAYNAAVGPHSGWLVGHVHVCAGGEPAWVVGLGRFVWCVCVCV